MNIDTQLIISLKKLALPSVTSGADTGGICNLR